MKTALIGFKVSRGEMDKNGEKVPYNSRTIRFITDMGQSEADAAHLGDKDDVGFSPFEAKFKLDELAKILKVNPYDADVNAALISLINKSVICQFAPVYGELKCVSFELSK